MSSHDTDPDQTTNEEADTQKNPASNVLTSDERKDDGDNDAKQNPDAPQHGGFARPV